MIKTITIDGSEEITLSSEPYFYKSEKYAWIKNKSSDEMFASAGGENYITIPAGLSGRIEIPSGNKIFLMGSGDAEIHTSDVAVCPFRSIGTGGGGGGSAVLGTKTVTDNGVYNASADGFDGFSRVTVDVSASPDVGEINITENGTYTAADDSLDGYDIVNVNVDTGLTLDYVDGNMGYISMNKFTNRDIGIRISKFPYNIPDGSDVTFEYVLRADSGRTHSGRYHQISSGFVLNDDPTVVDGERIYYFGVTFDGVAWIDNPTTGLEIAVPQDRDMTMTLRFTEQKMTMFIDGVYYAETELINSTMFNPLTVNETYFMYGTTSNRDVSGKFYAARFYSRALTDAEIMHNHEQDLKLIEFINN